MVVLKNGNVGIGTTTPGYPLTVYNNVERIRVLDSANIDHRLRLYSGESGNYVSGDYDASSVFNIHYNSSPMASGGGMKFEYGTRAGSVTDTTYPAALEFSPRGLSATTPALYSDSSGNVGIGTTNPLAPLQINPTSKTNLTTTTPTAIVTGTPGVNSTVYFVRLAGLVQNASNAGTNTPNFYVSQSTAADVIKVKAGSWCRIW